MNQEIRNALEALNHVDVDVRAKAIETLGEYGYVDAVPDILAILDDADPGTTFIAVKALGKLADQQATPALLDQLRGDDTWVRAAAAGALINIGTPAVDGLTEALQDSDKNVRRAAAKALGKIGESGENEQAVRGLSVALLDIDHAVRRFAAEAIGRIGAEDMVPQLSDTLNDSNAKVRIAAFKALANINTVEASQAVRQWVRE